MTTPDPRLRDEELEAARDRIAQLEEENRALRDRCRDLLLAQQDPGRRPPPMRLNRDPMPRPHDTDGDARGGLY